MKKVYFILLWVMPFAGYAQKSIIEQEKPKPVKLSLHQKNTAKFLSKAGNSLIGGVALAVVGTFIASSEGGGNSKTIGHVMQIGGAGALVFSGVSLLNAAKSYEKSLKEIKEVEVTAK